MSKLGTVLESIITTTMIMITYGDDCKTYTFYSPTVSSTVKHIHSITRQALVPKTHTFYIQMDSDTVKHIHSIIQQTPIL